LYELPDNDGIWRTWAHANAKIIGINMASLKGPLGKNFDGFWKVFSGIKNKTESKGYYTWKEKSGTFREKYMVCKPVPGTSYVIASTTYMDEFTQPIEELNRQSLAAADGAKTINTVSSIVFSVLVALIVLLYGRSFVNRIKYLTDATDKISMGDLEAEIKSQSNDELGALAASISRMQYSLRLSMERLMRKRQNDQQKLQDSSKQKERVCPSCNKAMKKRNVSKGPHAGKQFWVCSDYPACASLYECSLSLEDFF
jgi:methyl-accepting chemotaxis protein